MNNVNKTLYIPLYGKAYVSRRGVILQDTKAEEIWAAEGFPLKGKSAPKWLSFYMGMRAAVFDRWVKQQLQATPDAAVLHLGCGMDSRNLRVGDTSVMWYDIDFEDVIAQRRKYYTETEKYKMLGADVRNDDFQTKIPLKKAIVIMEGISMYLTREELYQVFTKLSRYFEKIVVLMDCYTEFAAKASKYKNPINDVGVTQVYGLDDPVLAECESLRFACALDMTPDDLIDQLRGSEKLIFSKLYAGSVARKMYRLYEYRKL